ncbi:MAG: Sir2 family NAD-dependent protein deacetylase [Planctomycetaceae bacterium]|nr:Sir2 family NAD-dependent protein deacetylase [Planctomycetaceae bacterium]
MTIRTDENSLPHAAAILGDWVRQSTSTVAFTGAGISTESGIPDFRSPGGVWSRYRTVYFQEFCDDADARYEYWRQKAEAHQDFASATPNITHTTLANLEQQGSLRGVITQNIDGLHQAAGSRQVQELHGTARQVSCLDCGWIDNADPWVARFLADDRVPDCPECGGRLKHATVSFGQSMPAEVMQTSASWSRQAKLFLAMGSSLVVEPAASLPRLAVQSGAKLVIINRDPTPLDYMAHLIVHTPLGMFFEAFATAS